MRVTVIEIQVQLSPDGTRSLAVFCEFDNAPVTVLIPEEALAERMILYGLRSGDEALVAILREHAQRIGGLEPEGLDRVEWMGGLRSDVTVLRQRVKVSDEARGIINGASRDQRS